MPYLMHWLRALLLSALTLTATLIHAQEDFLEPEQAFPVQAQMLDGQQVRVSWDIAKGYYLYRDRIHFTSKTQGVSLAAPAMPSAHFKNDPNFGDVYIYKGKLTIDIPVQGNGSFDLQVKFQGCAEAGLCYPPQTKTFTLTANAASAEKAAPAEELSESDRIATMLSDGNLWLTIAFFFGVGLLLAFTPCVFPMIPILSSIIVGQGQNITTRRAFNLSLVYVLAMALTYTAAGVLAGLFGANLQAAFQNPWVLTAFSAIFVALALSMFGFYELQLPASLQAKIADISNKQQGGTVAGVAIMGFLSALIVGPCVAPPLAGALIYIGQTGDALLGGAALFALSMGMGIPLLLVGTAAGKFMPRAGGWMDAVKAVFGVALLAVAIWMLSRILPDAMTLLLWALLAIASAVYLGAFDAANSGFERLWKALGIVLLLWGVFLLIAVASGGSSALTPLKHLVATGSGHSAQASAHPHFRPIANVNELDAAIQEANQQGKIVMLDFYADWCVTCKEMEQFTFSDPMVASKMNQLLLLQADITANTDAHQALLKRFGLVGPPAILFFDTNGQERRALRIVGFMNASDFAQQLDRASQH